MDTTRRTSAPALAVLSLPLVLGTALPLQALAANPTAHVRLADLDLATPAGDRELDRRLRAAIEAVCDRPNDHAPYTPGNRRHVAACRAAAGASIQQQLVRLGVSPQVRAAQR